ncbi:hypothetical protein LK996_08855 [Lysobacter sp. A6]|uniref:RHS repeat-associated protein n=1 Tax=Noviluteimonas lactosilytica TaxID=2888523 RepID=A0ABS8JHY2_9GAMM|nr:RHS repeat-associated core domain-containing protein [Lysobacter lactosilyticus]MCC8363182.1 hypothetical protein [Lysobacter lactosilyticus]
MARLLSLLLLLCVACPAQARFVSADPVEAKAESGENFNRYAYGNNNPHRYTDPDGRWAEDLILGVPSVAIGGKSLYDNARAGRVGPAIADGIGLAYDFGAILLPGVPGGAGLGIQAGRAAAARLPDAALVVRGGTNIGNGGNTAQKIAEGTKLHPDGVLGFSAQSAADATLCQLCASIPNGQVGVTTVGQVRQSGGDVISTSGQSSSHVTVTGLDPNTAQGLFRIEPNPAKQP